MRVLALALLAAACEKYEARESDSEVYEAIDRLRRETGGREAAGLALDAR